MKAEKRKTLKAFQKENVFIIPERTRSVLEGWVMRMGKKFMIYHKLCCTSSVKENFWVDEKLLRERRGECFLIFILRSFDWLLIWFLLNGAFPFFWLEIFDFLFPYVIGFTVWFEWVNVCKGVEVIWETKMYFWFTHLNSRRISFSWQRDMVIALTDVTDLTSLLSLSINWETRRSR